MTEHQRIQAACSKLKEYWYTHKPMCILCLQGVKRGQADLVHKIRRSETSDIWSTFELQTMKENTGLGHRVCHNIFDNDLSMAKYLPGFNQVMRDIKRIDIKIYNKLKSRL